jgi:acyl-CoA synthetase (AMP-forming)/AMP-acid ligase II
MNDPTLFDLSSVFSTVAGAVPDQEMLVWRQRRLTYREVDRRIDALATYLHAAGLAVILNESIWRGTNPGKTTWESIYATAPNTSRR